MDRSCDTNIMRKSIPMFRLTWICLVAFFVVTDIVAQNNVPCQKVRLADPFILLYNGMYYAYGTHAADGIEVYTSKDLRSWDKSKTLALHKNDSFGEKWFWAPEVYHVNGKFYMYYSADEHICVATSDSPLGPFRQMVQKPMLEEEKAIDNSLFVDDDGKAYLFFVRFNDGNNVWVAELENDLMTLKKETMHHCISVSQPWEEVWPRVNEGPFVIKHKGVYYMTYSANSYESPFYGVGCATATEITGDWTKYPDNPLLQNHDGLQGVGHSAIFRDKRKNLRIVFHAHHSVTSIHPREMYIGSISFRKLNGVERMYIEKDDFTPCLNVK